LINFQREKYEDGIGDSPQRSNNRVNQEYIQSLNESKEKQKHTCKCLLRKTMLILI